MTRNIKMLTCFYCYSLSISVPQISMGSVSSYHDKEHQNAYCRCLTDREQHMHCDKEHQNAYFDPVSLQRLPGFSARATVSRMPLRSLEKCTQRDKPDSFCSASQRRSPALDTSCRVNDTRQWCHDQAHCTVNSTSSVSCLAGCQ